VRRHIIRIFSEKLKSISEGMEEKKWPDIKKIESDRMRENSSYLGTYCILLMTLPFMIKKYKIYNFFITKRERER
jgi:hypothetical protein